MLSTLHATDMIQESNKMQEDDSVSIEDFDDEEDETNNFKTNGKFSHESVIYYFFFDYIIGNRKYIEK